MTSDCYAILGVTPAAEDVVIGAAYRALMRHYHPDTNHDPQAQTRAAEVAAAYAMLRDPQKRADYDAQRAAGGDWWAVAEPDGESPPPMRTAGIATTLLAALLIGALWLWPQPDPPAVKSDAAAPARQAHEKEAATQPRPVQPAAITALADPPVAPPVASAEITPDPQPAPQQAATPVPPVTMAKLAVSSPAHRPQRRAVQAAKQTEQTGAPKDARVATLDKMSTGFFSQSMANATGDKKQLLLAARDRSETQRKACKSDSCVADAYVRQIRETGDIMQKPPPNDTK